MGIEVLDPGVVSKIAAGEVVERPASVVKELVENSLDAGARAIEVEIIGGGCDLIRVADDGEGIPRRDLPRALRRHATSKITSLEDLDRVSTLGFRGEALASISAVSALTLSSRHAEDSHGYQVSAVVGEAGALFAVSRAIGTTVMVERLFFNVPARRKFLRSAAAEAGQISQVLNQFALAYPEVAFKLVSDGRLVLATSGSGDALDAAFGVLGREVAEALLLVEASVETDQPSRRLAARIRGHVADTRVTRSARTGVWLFINRRPIRSRSFLHAVEEGYHTLLETGRHPVAVLNLDVPPFEVDVNVHPAKWEVRLLRERLIYGGLRDAVRAALVSSGGWARPIGQVESANAGDASMPVRLVDAAVADASVAPEVAGAGGRRLPILRVLGQVAQTYIVAEGEHGLYLVDQHAAHERVLLDRLLKAPRGEADSQLMLEPESLSLDALEAEFAAASRDDLESLGYRLEEFGKETVLLRGVPGGLPEGRAIEALKATLADLSSEAQLADRREQLAIALSCRSAVKAGQTLSPEEMRALIADLEEADITRHCSHGRPTAILLSHSQLEREFGRR